MEPHERIDALIQQSPESVEWTNLYQLVADLLEADSVAYALARLRNVGNPLHRRRPRRLLARTGHIDLTAADIEQLTNDIANGDDEDRFSALAVAMAGRVKSLPAEILLPLATDTTDQNSLIPSYAAWLMVHDNALPYATEVEHVLCTAPTVKASEKLDTVRPLSLGATCS